MKNRKPYIVDGLVLLVPFLLWAGIFRGFYRNGLCVQSDAWGYFDHIKYYLDNICRGVYPLWDPFSAWGRPDDLAVRWIGEFNPLLFLIALLKALGLSFSLAYFVYWVGYYFLGIAGYYLLAKQIFQDKRPAYLAMLLLLFSSQGATLFNDNANVLLFVPSAWFFYFLLAFLNGPQRRSALGLTFCCMVLAVTYMPFYFLTVFLSLAVGCLLLFPRRLVKSFKRVGCYGFRHPWLSLLSAGAVVLSLLPGVFWYLAAGSGEYAVGWRHTGASGANVSGMSLYTASLMGAAGPYPLLGLFQYLRTIEVGLLYVPVSAFLFLGVGAVLKVSRRLVLFSGVGVFLVLVSMTNATPVHEFFFRHVFYFRVIRNLQYLVWLSLPVFFLAVADLFQRSLSLAGLKGKKQHGCVGYVFVFHLFACWFLTIQEGTLPSAYFGVAASLLFWVGWIYRMFPRRRWVLYVLLFLGFMVHPLEVLTALMRNSAGKPILYKEQRFEPRFVYVRPALSEERLKKEGIVRNTKDTSGFILKRSGGHKYIGTKSSYRLHEAAEPDRLEGYTRHKFIVVDRIQPYDDDAETLPQILDALYHNKNVAFIHHGQETFDLIGSRSSSASAWKVLGPAPELEVIDFDLNNLRLRTGFSVPKFLVYNDSYHSGWRVTVNGRPEKVFRTNLAFKGVRIPAGDNKIVFSFGHPARQVFNGLLGAVFCVILITVVILYARQALRQRLKRHDNEK